MRRNRPMVLLALIWLLLWPGFASGIILNSDQKALSKVYPKPENVRINLSLRALDNDEKPAFAGSPKRSVDPARVQWRIPKLTAEQKSFLQGLHTSVPEFEINFDESRGIPVFIKGNPLYRRTSGMGLRDSKNEQAEVVAYEALEYYRDLMKIVNPEREFRKKKEIGEGSGRKHLRFEQYWQDIPVYGKEITVHLDKDGNVYLIEGRYIPTPQNINSLPRISGDEAYKFALDDLGAVSSEGQNLQGNFGMSLTLNSPRRTELVVFEDAGGMVHLAWLAELCKGMDCWRYFVDAHTGSIIEKYRINQQVSVSGSGVDIYGKLWNFGVWQENGRYYCIDTSLPIHAGDPSVANSDLGTGNVAILDLRNVPFDQAEQLFWVVSDSPSSWDSKAVTLLQGLKATLDYYYRTFGRRGMDGNSKSAVGVINLPEANAFYASSFHDFMFFGNGDGGTFAPLLALDVIAHEFTHGVTNYTARLEYKFQSGALNEAFSDIFAAMVDRDDWLIGEDVILTPPYNLRNLIDPHQSLQPQPADMTEYQELPIDRDNGGVHINATIPAHMAYLISETLGREKTERIFYQALTAHLTPTSTFWDLCRALEESANELYGNNEVNAVRTSCAQVGITEESGSGDSGGTTVPAVSGKDYILFFFAAYNSNSGDYSYYLGEIMPDGRACYLSETPVHITRPTLFYGWNPNFALFIDEQFNLRAANVVSEEYEEYVVGDSGNFWSVSTTPASNYIVFTSIWEDDNKIYLFDYSTGKLIEVPIRFVPPDGGTAIEALYPDVVSMGLDGRTVYFDCISRLKFQGTYTYEAWTIGRLDISSGHTELILPVPPPGYHVGNPAAAQVHPYLVAYDVVHDNTVETRVLNMRTGKSGLVWQGIVSDSGTSGWPSFSGEDEYVYLQDFRRDTNEVIIRVPLVERGDVWVGKYDQAEYVYAHPEGLGVVTVSVVRPGTRSISPKAEVSSQRIDFGTVPVGSTVERTVTLRNVGNYPLMLEGAKISGESCFNVSAPHVTLDPGKSYNIHVAFSPTSTGTHSAGLTLYTNDPQTPSIEIALAGNAVEDYSLTVQRAYVAYYGRPADPAGLDYWTGALIQAGGSLAGIIEAFGNSNEFRERFGSLQSGQLITGLYQQMFGRDPDPAGYKFYTEQLEKGAMTLQSIALDIMYGAQGKDSTVLSNRIEVAQYFTSYLRSHPGCRYQTVEDINRASAILRSVDHTRDSVTSAIEQVNTYCSRTGLAYTEVISGEVKKPKSGAR